MSFKPLALSSILILCLSGCQVGPSYSFPENEGIPKRWKEPQSEVPLSDPVSKWWEVFDDETLNSLENQALQNNNELYAALSRVAQARAIAGVKNAEFFPQLYLIPGYSNQDVLTELYVPPKSNVAKVCPEVCPQANHNPSKYLREHQITNTLPLTLQYELDLWGYVLSQYQSAVYNAQAECFAYEATLLILTSDLADAYFQLRSIDAQLVNYRMTIITREKALEINQARFDSKIANFSEVSRAALEKTDVEAEYYDYLRQRELMENRIAVLIGVSASSFSLPENPLETLPPGIPAGIPADVLIQRPDINQAERARAANHALINVAYASFLPSITLTGLLGFSSPDLHQFLNWKSRLWGFGAHAAQVIFDGGARFSNLLLAESEFQEADYNYRQTVLVAFREVEDSLADLRWLEKEKEKIKESVKSARITYKITDDRFLNGLTFYLDVVDTERDVLNTERHYIRLLGLQYSATIQLIKALGGTWD